MVEILGFELSIVGNSGLHDVARIIEQHNVGVVIEDSSSKFMNLGLQRLNELRKDPELPERCTHAAEEAFSLEAGAQVYRELYRGILK